MENQLAPFVLAAYHMPYNKLGRPLLLKCHRQLEWVSWALRSETVQISSIRNNGKFDLNW